MIISCVNCNKKFNLDEKFIPEKGRLLQCSSCNHKWHFSLIKNNENKEKIIKKENKKIEINPSITEVKEKISSKNLIVKTNNKLKNDNKNDNKNVNIKKKINVNINSINFLNIFIVSIISFVGLVLLLDSFKQYIGIYFPALLLMLDNLYQTLLDIKSFVKDLIS